MNDCKAELWSRWAFDQSRNQQNGYAANVRFGSLADIVQRPRHVCFSPNSGHSSARVARPLSAKSGHQPSPVERGRYSLDQTVPSEDNARCGSLADTRAEIRDVRCCSVAMPFSALSTARRLTTSAGRQEGRYILVSSIKGSSSVYLNPHRRPFPSWRSISGTARPLRRSCT